MLKLDADGNVEWQEVYAIEGTAVAFSVQQTSDGGSAVLGSTGSYGAGGGSGTSDFWLLKLDGDGNIANCATNIDHGVDGVVSDVELEIADTEATVLDSAATVTDTEASVENSESIMTEPCVEPVFFYTLELSGITTTLGGEIQAFTSTTDPLVQDVTFRWIKPNGIDIAREVTIPIDQADDIYAPDEPGDWTIEADFNDGQIVRKTLSVSFFVLPESPVGVIAMILSSMGAFGGYLYFRSGSWRTRSKSS